MDIERSYDAIVIGSGMTGGWAAKELTEHGLRTLVLEAGRNITPQQDYVEHVQPWQKHFHGWQSGRKNPEIERNQYYQKDCYACDEWSGKFFVNDRENPYTFDEDKPFRWIRGRQVGGRSIMWGRQVYRWSDLDFEANAREGIGVDWPIRYADIEPWYDYVERFIGISGLHEGLPQLPDGQFLKPMNFTCVEQAARDAIAQKFGRDRVLTIGRCAILTENHNGRAACHYCGACERGCITLSYFSSINSTLPAARKTGRMTLRPHSVVESLIYDAGKHRVSGVRFIDAISRKSYEVSGRVIFLCASSLESARLLLNSKSTTFPDGLANSSGQVGHNIMDHVMGGGAHGTMPGYENHHTYGGRPNGIYVPRFRNVSQKSAGFLRGYGFQGGSGRGRRGGGKGFGADFKKRLFELGPWGISLYGFGECLPREDNYVELDPAVTDAWGIPALRTHVTYGPNEEALLDDMVTTATELLEAAGAKNIGPTKEQNPPGLCIHEMGSARMGRDPKTSVLNAHNQAHDVPNLFLTDGSCMASSGCQNPSITYMALTARAVDYAVGEMKRNAI